jgi:hypothetical protein
MDMVTELTNHLKTEAKSTGNARTRTVMVEAILLVI